MKKMIMKKKKNDFYVYIHVKPHNGEIFYVGKGRGDRAYSTDSRNKLWYNVVNKYGYDILIIENNLAEQEAFELEEKYIKRIGRRNSKVGTGTLVNMTDGGEGTSGHKHSEESKRKMSKVHTGKKVSEEARQKISTAQTGRTLSEETRQKMSKAAKKRSTEEYKRKLSEALTGRKFSEETRQKMSESNKGNKYALGYKHTDETKRKMSESNKGNKYALGYKHSDETKRKISEASKKYWADRKAKEAE